MCGIVGAIGLKLSAYISNSIVDTLKHRGPDDRGYILDQDKVFLGHRRL